MDMGEMFGGSYNCKAWLASEKAIQGAIRGCSNFGQGGPKRVIGR